MEVAGVNGQIVVDENWVTIKRKGAMAMLTQGIKGDKRIPIANIISVQFSKKRNKNVYIFRNFKKITFFKSKKAN